jgi:hypothetical protein
MSASLIVMGLHSFWIGFRFPVSHEVVPVWMARPPLWLPHRRPLRGGAPGPFASEARELIAGQLRVAGGDQVRAARRARRGERWPFPMVRSWFQLASGWPVGSASTDSVVYRAAAAGPYPRCRA